MGHQDTKLTSMRPRLKELNDIPYVKLSAAPIAGAAPLGLMSENTNNYTYYTIASMIILSPMTTSLMPDFLFLLKQKLII